MSNEIKIWEWVNIESKHEGRSAERVMVRPARQRKKPYSACFVMEHEYNTRLRDGGTMRLTGFVHNNGFDCNYRREWKTLKGVERYIKNKIGDIATPPRKD